MTSREAHSKFKARRAANPQARTDLLARREAVMRSYGWDPAKESAKAQAQAVKLHGRPTS